MDAKEVFSEVLQNRVIQEQEVYALVSRPGVGPWEPLTKHAQHLSSRY
jgi:hypothetical protein